MQHTRSWGLVCALVALGAAAPASAQHRVTNVILSNRSDDWAATQQQRFDPNVETFMIVTTSQAGGTVRGECTLRLSATGDVLARRRYDVDLAPGASGSISVLQVAGWPNAPMDLVCVPDGFPGGAFTRSLHAGFYTRLPTSGAPPPAPPPPAPERPASQECRNLRAVYNYAEIGNADASMLATIRARQDTACAMGGEDAGALYWSNGALMRARGLDGAWYFPNGQLAFEAGADGAAYYPNGQLARGRGSDGERYYPNGQLARQRGFDGQWYLPNGRQASVNDVIAWACERSSRCREEMDDIERVGEPTRSLWILDFAYRASR